MENIDFKKFIGLLIICSVIVSAFVTVGIFVLLAGGDLKNIFNGNFNANSVQPAILQAAPLGAKEVSEKIIRQDELVVRVVEKTSPAVVSIIASKDVPVVEQYLSDPFGGDPFFEQFFGRGFGGGFQVPQYRQKGTKKEEASLGTGFLVSADGVILTNKHVVADDKADYTVLFNDGAKSPAKVLARDPVQDFAILKIEKSDMPFLTLGRSENIKIGQSVIAIGNALGEFGNSVSVGIVSGLHRDITAQGSPEGPEALQELIQTDAAINPGNSGGPLLNIYGEVIGINVAVAYGAENIGFAIPINKIKKSLNDVQTQGRIIYPFLGVRYAQLNPEIVKARNLSVSEGALVISDKYELPVLKDSPAEKAGLKEGDVIIEIAGEKITVKNTLASIIQKHNVGENISLKIIRDNKEMTLSATLAERK